MNESAPAPVRPPVPGWERFAAGTLAAGLVAWLVTVEASPLEWWSLAASCLVWMQDGWQRVVGGPSLNWQVLFGSPAILSGVLGGLVLARILGTPLLIVWASIAASSRERRIYRIDGWWLVLGHGLGIFVFLLVGGRYTAVRLLMSGNLINAVEPWHHGWLTVFFEHCHSKLIPYCLLGGSEILLAALVLGVGWWWRRAKAGNGIAAGSAEGAGSRA